MNNSSTGGYIVPHPQPPTLNSTPANLTLVQFIQTILAALSEFPGSLVRPDWQQQPPKQPDINVNWLGFGIKSVTPDANSYQSTVQTNPNDPTSIVSQLQRQELIEVMVQVYGPNAYDNITLIRDGFQIQQNLALLNKANMAFAYDQPAYHAPDLVNERWFERYVSSIFLRRYVIRTYPILNFISANGTIYTDSPATETNFQAG